MHILFVGRFLPARLKRIGALALVGTFLSAAAQATPLVWTLDQVSYGDGTLVTGSFTFDAATTTFSGLSLTTSGGSRPGGAHRARRGAGHATRAVPIRLGRHDRR